MESLHTAIQKLQFPQDVALDFQSQFAPFEKQAREWEAKAKALVVTDISQVEEMKQAREARLALRRIRLDVDKKHKEMKADALRKGQMLDLIKRTLDGYITPLEAHLQAQEDFAEVQAAKRKQQLYDERLEALAPCRTPGDMLHTLPLGEMDGAAFEAMLVGLQAAKEAREAKAHADEQARKEAEQKAKEERERAQQERERQNRTNARVAWVTGRMGMMWSEENKAYQYDDFTITVQDINDANKDEFQELINGLMPQIKAAREAKEAETKRQLEALAKLEQEKKEREAKEEAERKAKAAAERKLKRAPDKVKLLEFASRIELIEPIQVKDETAQAFYNDAVARLSSIVRDIKEQCEKL